MPKQNASAEREVAVRAELDAEIERLRQQLKECHMQLSDAQEKQSEAEAGLVGCKAGVAAVHRAKFAAQERVKELDAAVVVLEKSVQVGLAREATLVGEHAEEAAIFAEHKSMWNNVQLEIEQEREASRQMLQKQRDADELVVEHQSARKRAEDAAEAHQAAKSKAEADKMRMEERAITKEKKMATFRLDAQAAIRAEQKARKAVENELVSYRERLKAANAHVTRIRKERDRGQHRTTAGEVESASEVEELRVRLAETEAESSKTQMLAAEMREETSKALAREREAFRCVLINANVSL